MKTSFRTIPVENFVTIHLLTITLVVSTYNFNFGKNYNYIIPCKYATFSLEKAKSFY